MTDNEFKEKFGITKDDGELVSLSYLRSRVMAHVRRVWLSKSTSQRRSAVNVLLDPNGNWLRRRSGQTIGSVCRDAEFDVAGNFPEE